MPELRPYQAEAVEAVYRHLREHDDNPCVVLPTAAGKTWVISQICRDSVIRWHGRVLILAHVRELLEQAVEKLRLVDRQLASKVGVYSAGLKRRDTQQPVIVAGIQSVYKRASELGAFDLVIVDESHLITTDRDGIYRRFLREARSINPNLRIIGLTATPYRMKSGLICGPDNILNTICYEVGVRELIVQKYLCPLVSKAGVARADTSGLHIRGGEFIAGEVEDLMNEDGLVRAACREVVEYTRDRHSVLIFASGIRHGRHIQRILENEHGVECGFVCGETPRVERDKLLARFRKDASEPLKYLCNVNVLTTGFDAPNIDCVAMLRPTNSPGLLVQMAGRGFRIHPSKKDCLILDFGGNILRHGPVDRVRPPKAGSAGGEAPAKECPACHALIHAAYSTCPQCGHEFPPPERSKHSATASGAPALSGQATVTEYEVEDLSYHVHTRRGSDETAPKTMRVDYHLGYYGGFKSEWVCFEHDGYPRHKAEKWWRERSNEPVPDTAAEAVELARSGALADTSRIKVRSVAGERFDRIVGHTLGDKPAARPRWKHPDGSVDIEALNDYMRALDLDMEDIPF